MYDIIKKDPTQKKNATSLFDSLKIDIRVQGNNIFVENKLANEIIIQDISLDKRELETIIEEFLLANLDFLYANDDLIKLNA